MSLPVPTEAAVFGAGGGIGRAFTDALCADPDITHVHAISRSDLPARDKQSAYTYTPDEHGVQEVVGRLPTDRLGLIIVAIGTLHDDGAGPEKTIRALDPDRFLEVMRTNALVPALIAKALFPTLRKPHPVTFAALSARVGSISDNRLGGWHSYRASKAALNMLVRNLAIEMRRTNENGIAVTLHPGTVDTALSAPFQANVPDGKLFTPSYSTNAMLKVLNALTPENSGKCFDYAGKEIAP